MAAFEAVGYAKFCGRVGVCAATSGPGAIHLLNGLYDAKLDHVPVVAIVGQTERSAMGGSYQQEVDLLSLFKDVCSDYVQMCTVPAAAAQPDRPGHPDRAERAGADLPDLPVRRPRAASTSRRGTRSSRCRPASGFDARRPSRPTTPRSARPPTCSTPARRSRCWSARAPAAASTELTEVADLLGAGAAKALLGKDVLPDDLPWVTGSIGLLGHDRQLPDDDGLRHAADRRLELPVHAVPARRSTRRGRSRSTGPASGSACATRTSSTSSATPRRRCRR